MYKQYSYFTGILLQFYTDLPKLSISKEEIKNCELNVIRINRKKVRKDLCMYIAYNQIIGKREITHLQSGSGGMETTYVFSMQK